MKTLKKTCAICGEIVYVPPGVKYRGKYMHKQEAEHMRLQNVATEKIVPKRVRTEMILNRLLEDAED